MPSVARFFVTGTIILSLSAAGIRPARAQTVEIRGSNGSVFSTGPTGSSMGWGTGANGLVWDSSSGPFLSSTLSSMIMLDSDNNDADIRYFAIGKNATTFGGGTELLRLTERGNLGLGSSTFGNGAYRVLALGGSVPGAGSAVSNAVQLFGWQSIYSPYPVELWVMDSSGNTTGLSSHNRALLPPDDPAEVYPWSFYTRNPYIGVEQNVDMVRLVRAVERLSGEQFLYWAPLPPEDVRDWYADHREELLNRALEAGPEVEVALGDAWESVDKIEEVRTKVQQTTYRLDLDRDPPEIIPVTREVETIERRPTGDRVRQLKPGIRFDEKGGKLYRNRRPEEITLNPAAIPRPPDWIQARLAR